MASTLPPDPYKALGVTKDAQLPEIRSAHRKLVLKCHPDKVQDAALKAVKQDEFQKVQQAYELLSDDSRRTQYDEQVKLFELRKEMADLGRSKPTARSNPFEYEVRTAEPRSNTYPRSKQSAPSSPKMYHMPPRSYEDVLYEEPKSMPRKTASYDSTDRKRTSTRDEERKRHEEDERSRQKFEKEKKHATHAKEKKSRDKEKKRGADEKHTRAAAYVQDESDEYVPPRTEKKSTRHRMEDEIRQREEVAKAKPAVQDSSLTAKYDAQRDLAGQYMQRARRQGASPVVESGPFHPGHLRRAETFTATTFNVRHVTPQRLSDDDTPRRSSASSARKESRRPSDTPPSRTRDKSSKGSSRKSPPRDPYIVEPPSPPPRKPSLQTHASAPPNITSSSSREKPSRSKTDYPRKEAPQTPPLPRAATFHGERGDRSRDRGGSRLKSPVEYSSAESDSDSPAPNPQRRSHSPARRSTEHTHYHINNGRSVPISRDHRADLRDLNEGNHYPRERSESPRGGRRRSKERPSTARVSSDRSRPVPSRSQTQAYYTPDAPEPTIHTTRPKMPPREDSYHNSRDGYFNVKYAPNYTDKVIYSSAPPEIYRSRPDPRDHYYPHQRGGQGRPEIYT